ncbi:MAG: glycoside hydrolase family 32 protein [Kiritimatiellae bacterium]|nr:glycoside hydrolase family 32 protein [Kiritimatiellia bacterium]
MQTSRFAIAFSLVAAAATAGTVTVKPTGRYMAVPVENGAPKVRLEVFDGATRVAYDDVEWARGMTNWTGSLDLRGLAGRALEFRFSGNDVPELTAADLKFAEAPFPAPKGQYDEPWRPQFHFTPPLGWNNDPNGLSYRDGEWHMFYQHNPFGVRWGNMHWGHAVSKDLVHWNDFGDVIAPDDHGPMFSGSAVVDHGNTSGFGKGAHVLIYTAAGRPHTQRVAWSLDGRNYAKWPKAAVEGRPDANRDPKVVWYAPGRHWVMAVYGEVEKGRHGVSLFASKNLKDWTLASNVPGDLFDEGKFLYECPDFFELPIKGETGTRWVLTAANRQYAIGTFDGRTFVPETTRLEQTRPVGGLNPVYAWQSFSDAPGGRRIQIAWSHFDSLAGGRTDATSNQGMTLPMELSLVRTADGLRLARFPVKELESLRAGEATAFKAFEGELAEVEFACTPVADAVVTLDLRGVKIEYDAVKKTLSVNGRATAWDLDAAGRLGLHVFVDRVGLEIFSLDGFQYLPLPEIVPDPANRKLSWRAAGAKKPVRDVAERAWRLKSAVR